MYSETALWKKENQLPEFKKATFGKIKIAVLGAFAEAWFLSFKSRWTKSVGFCWQHAGSRRRSPCTAAAAGGGVTAARAQQLHASPPLITHATGNACTQSQCALSSPPHLMHATGNAGTRSNLIAVCSSLLESAATQDSSSLRANELSKDAFGRFQAIAVQRYLLQVVAVLDMRGRTEEDEKRRKEETKSCPVSCRRR